MKTIDSKPANDKETRKKLSFGAAGLSLFIHIGLFVLIGGVVVVEYAVPRSPIEGELVTAGSDEAPPLVDENPEPVGEPEATDNPAVEPARSEPAQTDLSLNSVDVIQVNNPVSSFQMPSAMLSGTGTGTGASASGTGQSGGVKGGGPGKVTNPFGGLQSLGKGSMEGVFYDLKQNPSHQATGMDRDKYLEVLGDFFKRGWDRSILAKFYRVKDPLYTSVIYMPLMDAGIAPKAFRVEKEVQPSQWVILYEGQFQSPQNGQFRFAGYADDILVVRVNGKVVLDGSIIASRPDIKLAGNPMPRVQNQDVVVDHKIGNGNLVYSAWMNLDASQVNQLEIVVGERPGGKYCAFLFIEEKGKSYAKASNGHPILPLFRLADVEPNQSAGAEFLKDGPVFGGKQ